MKSIFKLVTLALILFGLNSSCAHQRPNWQTGAWDGYNRRIAYDYGYGYVPARGRSYDNYYYDIVEQPTYRSRRGSYQYDWSYPRSRYSNAGDIYWGY